MNNFFSQYIYSDLANNETKYYFVKISLTQNGDSFQDRYVCINII